MNDRGRALCPPYPRPADAVGAHVEREHPLGIAGGAGRRLHADLPPDPQSWKKPPPSRGRGDPSPIDIYVHAPYLINVCSPKPNVRYGSRKS